MLCWHRLVWPLELGKGGWTSSIGQPRVASALRGSTGGNMQESGPQERPGYIRVVTTLNRRVVGFFRGLSRRQIAGGVVLVIGLLVLVGLLLPSSKSSSNPTAADRAAPLAASSPSPAADASATPSTAGQPSARNAASASPSAAVTAATSTPAAASLAQPPAGSAAAPAAAPAQAIPAPAQAAAAPAAAAPAQAAAPAPVRSVAPAAPAPASAPAATSANSSSAGCRPLSSTGRCYEAGQLCGRIHHGLLGIAANGVAIICADSGGWRWVRA